MVDFSKRNGLKQNDSKCGCFFVFIVIGVLMMRFFTILFAFQCFVWLVVCNLFLFCFLFFVAKAKTMFLVVVDAYKITNIYLTLFGGKY